MGSIHDCVVAGIDMTDLYPVPFPDGMSTVDLQTVSIAKLLSQDPTEAQRIFSFCRDVALQRLTNINENIFIINPFI